MEFYLTTFGRAVPYVPPKDITKNHFLENINKKMLYNTLSRTCGMRHCQELAKKLFPNSFAILCLSEREGGKGNEKVEAQKAEGAT